MTSLSPFRQSQIVFEPAFDSDADGCRGFVLPDETVWFGLFDVDVPAFPRSTTSAADGRGASPARAVVTTWLINETLR
ncbi:MAG: hypothetical protein ABW046_16980 [Actinoplanes sp.]